MRPVDPEALGARLVHACGVGPGKRVLDIASGPACAWKAAAYRGADVVVTEPTAGLAAAGRERADEAGLAISWVLARVDRLPFADRSFEIVMSAAGTPQAAAAREMVRVCRPGGTIGVLCGTAGSVAERFGDRVRWHTLTKEKLTTGAEAHMLAIGTPASRPG